jgi:hypothetical protein
VIARIWRGWTTPENADAYQRIASEEVLPSIAGRNLDGYHGAYLLRRDLDGEVEADDGRPGHDAAHVRHHGCP